MIELSSESQDTVIVNITWWQRRTRLEKKLVIGVVFVAGIILSFLIDAALHSQKEPPEVCDTEECVVASADILNQIDETVDPCNDFFKFACGRVLARAHHRDIPTETHKHQVKKQLINILLEPITKYDPPALSYEKQLVTTCVNEATNGTSIKVLKSIISDLGGWPVLLGEKWNGTNFNWLELIDKVKDIGFFYQTILQARLEEDPSEKLESNITVKSIMFAPADKHTHMYKKLLIEYAIALGAKETVAIEEMTETFDFMVKLNNLRSFNNNDTVVIKPRLQISELQKNYKEIDWLKYLKLLLDSDNIITEHHYVVFPHSEFLDNFSIIMNATKQRTIANYIIFSATVSVMPLVSNEFLELFNQFTCLKDMPLSERMEECQQAVSNIMYPIPSYLAYGKRNTPSSTRTQVSKMFNLISNELKKLIRINTWMDADSKDKAVKWLQNITAVIGIKTDILNKIYEKVHTPIDTNSSFLKNYLKIRKQQSMDRRTKNATEMDLTHFQIPNTQILFMDDDKIIILPAGILQGMYFDQNRPMYINYGILGKAIGSVLMYTYTQSATDDLDNKYKLWSPEVKKSFENKTSCVSHNFEFFGDEGNLLTSMKYYEKQFKIAQIMGIKLAYNAYKSWVNQNGEELNLVGLNYTESQTFWISALADACFEESYETEYNFYSDSEIVRHNFDFAIDFHCDLDSNMNPSNKCVVF